MVPTHYKQAVQSADPYTKEAEKLETQPFIKQNK
jgi:hypothetical protein